MSEITENDRGLHQLYDQFKAVKTDETKPKPVVRKLVERIRSGPSKKTTTEQIRQQIIELVRYQPGKYPLAELTFSHDFLLSSRTGFRYSFNYSLGEDEFSIGYWSYNDRGGILVQKHTSDYLPQIEVLGTEDDRGLTLLHLPEGHKIPVGPLHFEDDSLPMNEKELAAEKAKAIEIAERAGIKVKRDIIDMADRLSGPARKYPDRYFYWQPALPANPTNIAIDFDGIETRHMGLTLEDAPVFDNTMTIKDEEL